MPSTPQDHKPKKKTTKKVKDLSQSVPMPEDPNSKYLATSWGNGGAGGLEDLVVPSGQLCLVRRAGMEGLIRAGVLHDTDSLTALVANKHVKTSGKVGGADEINIATLMEDEAALDSVLHVMDKTICFAIVKPEVHMTPNDPTSRVTGVVYADMIDIVDKAFIFNFVLGGTRQLEPFREGLEDALGSVDAREDVPQEA